jgi:hypothetical protein
LFVSIAQRDAGKISQFGRCVVDMRERRDNFFPAFAAGFVGVRQICVRERPAALISSSAFKKGSHHEHDIRDVRIHFCPYSSAAHSRSD